MRWERDDDCGVVEEAGYEALLSFPLAGCSNIGNSSTRLFGAESKGDFGCCADPEGTVEAGKVRLVESQGSSQAGGRRGDKEKKRSESFCRAGLCFVPTSPHGGTPASSPHPPSIHRLYGKSHVGKSPTCLGQERNRRERACSVGQGCGKVQAARRYVPGAIFGTSVGWEGRNECPVGKGVEAWAAAGRVPPFIKVPTSTGISRARNGVVLFEINTATYGERPTT